MRCAANLQAFHLRCGPGPTGGCDGHLRRDLRAHTVPLGAARALGERAAQPGDGGLGLRRPPRPDAQDADLRRTCAVGGGGGNLWNSRSSLAHSCAALAHSGLCEEEGLSARSAEATDRAPRHCPRKRPCASGRVVAAKSPRAAKINQKKNIGQGICPVVTKGTAGRVVTTRGGGEGKRQWLLVLLSADTRPLFVGRSLLRARRLDRIRGAEDVLRAVAAAVEGQRNCAGGGVTLAGGLRSNELPPRTHIYSTIQVLRSMALRLVSPPPDAAAGGIVQAICSGVTGLMVPVAPAVTVGGTGLLSYGGTELS